MLNAKFKWLCIPTLFTAALLVGGGIFNEQIILSLKTCEVYAKPDEITEEHF